MFFTINLSIHPNWKADVWTRYRVTRPRLTAHQREISIPTESRSNFNRFIRDWETAGHIQLHGDSSSEVAHSCKI